MGDEGVGNAIIEDFEKKKSRFQGVDFLDLGTSGPNLIHAIAGRKKAILVDCSLQGSAPGTIRRFKPEEVREKTGLPHLSLHQGDVLGLIELSKQLGECPEEIIIFGIEPEKVGVGEGLSETLKSKLSYYVKIIEKDLVGA